jgi:hypothetical protein
VEAFVGRCHEALGELIRGDAASWSDLFSRSADVTLGNPFGPFAIGFDAVMTAARGAADRYRDGELLGFERIATHASSTLACVAEVERFRARVGDTHDMSFVSLRVTTVLRVEDGRWRVVHRHADPITTARTADSVVDTGAASSAPST